MESLPLRDIHLPDPIGWWPLAPGWWGLLGLLILIGVGLALWQRRRRWGPTPLQSALAELEALDANAALSPPEKLQALSILMKRVVLSFRSREEVAGLTGQDFLQILDQLFNSDQYSQGVGRHLVDFPYRKDAAHVTVTELFQLCHRSLSCLLKE